MEEKEQFQLPAEQKTEEALSDVLDFEIEELESRLTFYDIEDASCSSCTCFSTRLSGCH